MEEKSNPYYRHYFQIKELCFTIIFSIFTSLAGTSQCLTNVDYIEQHFTDEDKFVLTKHDRALFYTISKRFGAVDVRGFYFDDTFDSPEKNIGDARAYKPKEAPKGIIEFYGKNDYGYIGVGKKFSEYLAYYNGNNYLLNYRYPFIIAHEFSHIVQNNWDKFYMHPRIKKDIDVKNKYKELNADFGAGLYFSVYLSKLWERAKETCEDNIESCEFYTIYTKIITVVREYVCKLGDTDIGSIRHHGTCEERMANFMHGLDKYRDSQEGSIIAELEYHFLKLITLQSFFRHQLNTVGSYLFSLTLFNR